MPAYKDKVAYRVKDLREEIKSENRVGTLEQIEENIEAVKAQVRGMKEEKIERENELER